VFYSDALNVCKKKNTIMIFSFYCNFFNYYYKKYKYWH